MTAASLSPSDAPESLSSGDAPRTSSPVGATPSANQSGPPERAISVHGVSKKYTVYGRRGDRFLEWVTRKPRHRDFWALRDVSFDIQRGEIVGIVGRNGAGKTTLLRLLTGISAPSAGEIDVNYRMSAILELGSGFHPEFSGRDNVFLGGAVLGMSDEEIERKYDEIVAFSELGPYIDMPFKTYSLGMQARLSFAVAISVEPEIMIVDEALAAGDSYFIAKCFERIRQICASGATVLFVSHNLYLVQRLCRRALWFDNGRLVADGDPATVIRDYEAAIRFQEQQQLAERNFTAAGRFTDGDASGGLPATAALPRVDAPPKAHVWGTGEVHITAVEMLDATGQPLETTYSGDAVTFRIRYEGDAPYDDMAAIIQVTRADGISACTLDAREAGLHLPPLHGSGIFEVTLDPVLLGRGRYFLSPHIYRDRDGFPGQSDVLVYHDRLYEFSVERRGRPYDVALEQPATWRHNTTS